MSETNQEQSLESQPPATFFQNLINIVVSPFEAFASLDRKPTVLLPLLTLLGFALLAEVVYFSTVDVDYYIDSVLAQMPQNMPPNVLEAMEKGVRQSGTTGAILNQSLAIFILYPLAFAIYAGYLCLITAISKDGGYFKKWFSFQIWGCIPMVLGHIAIMVNMAVSNGQVGLLQRNPISLNNLIFSLEAGEEHYSTLAQIDITHIWALVLLVIGYKVMAKKNWIVSFLIVHTPTILLIALGVFLQSLFANMFAQ